MWVNKEKYKWLSRKASLYDRHESIISKLQRLSNSDEAVYHGNGLIIIGCHKWKSLLEEMQAVEQVVWDTLAYAWNKFCDLKQEHPQEQEEFMRGIHMCQCVLGMRLNRKNYPDIFYKMP